MLLSEALCFHTRLATSPDRVGKWVSGRGVTLEVRGAETFYIHGEGLVTLSSVFLFTTFLKDGMNKQELDYLCTCCVVHVFDAGISSVKNCNSRPPQIANASYW